jgi:hypothetical protein
VSGIERLLWEINGGRLTSSRTGWVPNLANTTRDDRLPRIEPGQDAQAHGVPTDTGVGTLSREVPPRLLGRVTLANADSDDLVDNRSLERIVAVPRSAAAGRCRSRTKSLRGWAGSQRRNHVVNPVYLRHEGTPAGKRPIGVV